MLCVAATLALVSASDRAGALARDAAVQSSWQSGATSPEAQTSPDAVFSRFNMKSATTSADLIWQATSASELRTSLRALDAAQIKLVQVKVTRSGANFLVTAERAP